MRKFSGLLSTTIIVASFSFFAGCGGSNELTVSAPPEAPQSLIPAGVDEEEYRRQMKEAGH